MTGIELKSIKGLLIKEIHIVAGIGCICNAHGSCECGCGADWNDYSTRNQAITEQGRRKITLNREKLAEILFKRWYVHLGPLPDWKELSKDEVKKNTWLYEADALIAALGEIIEYKEEG